MSQTRTIRELKAMIEKRKGMFKGKYAMDRRSMAAKNIQRQIDTLVLALNYVEESFRPVEALKEKLQTKLSECEGKAYFGNSYEEDKSSGWIECLEWLLEGFE